MKARNIPSKRKSARPSKENSLVTDYLQVIHWNTTTLLPPTCCEASLIKRLGLKYNQLEQQLNENLTTSASPVAERFFSESG